MLIGCFQPFQLCTRKVIFLAKISACTCTLFILNTFRATMFSGYLIIVSNTFSKNFYDNFIYDTLFMNITVEPDYFYGLPTSIRS